MAWVNVSYVLAEETVGFEAVADGLWDVYYRSVKLGRFSDPPAGSKMIAVGLPAAGDCQPCLRSNLSRISPTAHGIGILASDDFLRRARKGIGMEHGVWLVHALFRF